MAFLGRSKNTLTWLSRSTSKYPEVPQSTQKYIKDPRSTSKYPEVHRSTQKYLKVPRSTSKYPEVPQSTQKYQNTIWSVQSSLGQLKAVWNSLEKFGTLMSYMCDGWMDGTGYPIITRSCFFSDLEGFLPSRSVWYASRSVVPPREA